MFKVEEKRLREIGFITENDIILHIDEGKWKREGQYYVCDVVVTLKNGSIKSFILKCPWDMMYEIMEDPDNLKKGSSLIREHVEKRSLWSKRILNLGPYAIRIDKYDDGTMIMEKNETTMNLYDAMQMMNPLEVERCLNVCKKLLDLIEHRLGLHFINRVYIGGNDVEFSRAFVITRDGNIMLEDLDFRV